MSKMIKATDGEETVFHFELAKDLPWKFQIKMVKSFLDYCGFSADIHIKPYSKSQLKKRFSKGLPLLFSEGFSSQEKSSGSSAR